MTARIFTLVALSGRKYTLRCSGRLKRIANSDPAEQPRMGKPPDIRRANAAEAGGRARLPRAYSNCFQRIPPELLERAQVTILRSDGLLHQSLSAIEGGQTVAQPRSQSSLQNTARLGGFVA